MRCPYCIEHIKDDDDVMMIGLDKPYLNLYMHKGCYSRVAEHINKFLQENSEIIEQIYKESIASKSKKKK